MSKRILILEPTATIQSLFMNKLKKSGFELLFEPNGIKFLWSLFGNPPDAVFINVKCQNPKCIELVRLIKSVDKLKTMPVGIYTADDFPFGEFYLKNSGADMLASLNEKNIVENIDSLAAMMGSNKLSFPVQNDIIKSAITDEIFSMTANLEDMDGIIEKFLNMLADFCQVPACALFILEDNVPYGYYICASNFSDEEIQDFLKVCITDFETSHSDVNMARIVPKQLMQTKMLERFHQNDIPVSCYQNIPIMDSSLKMFGSLNVVKEGNFSARQIDLLNFCSEHINSILENAIGLKKKIFFEKHIRKAFSRFVPEQIIDELVMATDTETDKNTAVGEKRKVAILFSDIRSFTSISERNKPETLVAFLNRYFTAMVNVIKKHGGTIDKFIGDAIMAEFGVPISYEDNAARAVAAAMEMREALPDVPLMDLVMPEGMKFNIGIGIHYGDVTVGSIGSSDKTDYTVIGDSVNLASRLEGLTKTYGTMIIVSEDVKIDIPEGSFIFRYLDDVKVKGKAKSVPIYAIDKSEDDFSAEYKDLYSKGFGLYKQGIFNLAKEYFEKALLEVPGEKAATLMLERCNEFIANPPENWDGAITFHTK